MKKTILILVSVAMILSFSACGSNNAQTAPTTPEPMESVIPADTETAVVKPVEENSEDAPATETSEHKQLVIYFSVPETTSAENMNDEEDYSTFVRNGEVLGNVQYVAYLIQENTGADIFRVEPTTPYPMNHAELERIATQEKRDNAYPEIFGMIENFADYNTVFVGFPNWYGDMPRIMYTMFETYDFSGKTIIPFVVSGSSGFSGTIRTMTSLEPEATIIQPGYSITRTRMDEAVSGVPAWLAEINY